LFDSLFDRRSRVGTPIFLCQALGQALGFFFARLPRCRLLLAALGQALGQAKPDFP